MNYGGHQFRGLVQTTARANWRCVAALVGALVMAAGSCRGQAPAQEAAAVRPSPDLLNLVRKRVQEYFERFSDLTCKESVTQLVLNGGGRTIYREDSDYDYQFQTSQPNGNWKFDETRVPHSPAFRDPARTLLVTTGFASLLLVAHPKYEASYVFAPDGSETIGGVSYSKIRFMPIPGASSPATLRLRGKNYPLPMSGTLWVEPQTGAVVKIVAIVDSGLSDIGLAGMRSEVHFALHQFREPESAVWAPESATIDLETPRQHWRNLHRFTAYKKFDVNVHEEIGTNQ